MPQRDLLVLQPRCGTTQLHFQEFHDYWMILAKQGVTSVHGQPTVSAEECFWLMIGQLVLDGIDFEFDEHQQVPAELPDDLTKFRNLVIFTEDFEHHADRLIATFPNARAYAARQAEHAHPYRSTPSHDGRSQLYLRPLSSLVTTVGWGNLTWAMNLAMDSPAFKQRQLAVDSGSSFKRALERIRAGAIDPQWDALYPPCKLGPLLGREWTEVSALQQSFLMQLGDLLNEPVCSQIAEQSIRHYLNTEDWLRRPPNSMKWSMIQSVAQLYAKTGEPELLELIQLRLKERAEQWGQWNGCYGNWPDPPDQWLRDASIASMVAAAVQAVSLIDCPKIDKQAVYDQAIHQAIQCDELLRDRTNGLYRFGADGKGRQTPSFIGHGSYWHIFAYAQLLTYLPREINGYEQLLDIYRRLAVSLSHVQDDDGLWHQHLDLPATTDANVGYSAVFTASILRGLTLGVLDRQPFEAIAHRGLSGIKLRTFDGCFVGNVVGVGPSLSRRYYFNRKQGEELNFGTWQQLFLMLEMTRYRQHQAGKATHL